MHIRNIFLDLALTVMTCGLYNLFVQHRQMEAVNTMIGESRYDFWRWLLFTILTFGLYHVYHEWKKSTDIATAMGQKDETTPILVVVLTVFGLPIVADAFQQSKINEYFGDKNV